MNRALRSAAFVMTALPVLLGSAAASAQATVDTENRYPNVGALMAWRVDDSGKPIELRGFASGTLIRPRVMITAGHFTAPAKALGELPPTIRMFASFSPANARDPSTWIPVIAQATHPQCRTARHRRNAIRPTKFWSLRSSQASPTRDSSTSNVLRRTFNQPCWPRQAYSRNLRALARRSSDTASRRPGELVPQ